MRKYRNVPVTVDGIAFSSQKEAHRAGELRLLERAGQISSLRLQPRYRLVVNGRLVCSYVGDFEYVEGGEVVTEDVKSPITRKNPTYRVKAKLFHALIGREIREV